MRLLVLLLCCLPFAAVAATARIEAVDVGVHPDHTRVTLSLSGAVKHTIFTLTSPDRVVLDVGSATLASALPAGKGLVRDFRSGRHGQGVRIVFDLTGNGVPRSFFLPARGNRPARLVVDVYGGSGTGSTHPAPVLVAKKTAKPRDVVIAVDAGHGGFDPGAHGPNGVLEKHITLQISKRLAKLINAIPGMRAVLTRNDDRYLKLRQRTAIARAHGADMFISIHCNSSRYSSANGGAVFALSENGATSEAARWLADKENDADKLGGVSLDNKSPMLASVLLDMTQTATISASLQVGKDVLTQMGQFESLRRHRVEQAAFVVLKSPDIPSILVETAFISNPHEERQLNSAKFQNRMARAVLKGVVTYYHKHPPNGTLIAENGGNWGTKRYVISYGDTLSSIASQFSVSTQSLRVANGLDGTRIRAGQVLTIPAG